MLTFSKPTIETSQKSVKYVQSFLKYISFYIISFVLKFYKIMINSTKERIKTFNKLKTINLPLLTLSSIRIEFLQIIAKFSDISDEISDT